MCKIRRLRNHKSGNRIGGENVQEILATVKSLQEIEAIVSSQTATQSDVHSILISKFIKNQSALATKTINFNTTGLKLIDYVFYGNGTGDLDSGTDMYKIPIITRIPPEEITWSQLSVYPDPDGTVKTSSTSTKQKSVICEVEPDTTYTLHIDIDSSSASYNRIMGRVAGFSVSPSVGDSWLWLDTTLTKAKTITNVFTTDSNTHYVMIYVSYSIDDISSILSNMYLCKDRDYTVTFSLETPLAPSQSISKSESNVNIKAHIGDNILFTDVTTAPLRMYIRYEDGDT